LVDWIDKEFISIYGKIAGVDEAGRGPLAGPVVAAAVVLTPVQEQGILLDCPFINDSKKLSEKKRNDIWHHVQESGIRYAVGLADVTTIDYYNILISTNMAMNRALQQLKNSFDLALIDGKSLSIDYPHKQIVSGDSRSLRIALASNIAKVIRDKIMKGYSQKYPEYDFENNKGYGTKKHLKALESYGPTPFHRLTFKPLIEQMTENKLLEWVGTGQINYQRYERVFSKFELLYKRQKHLTGFF